MGDEGEREGGLVRWQWSFYEANHRTRKNLLIHLFTAPLFPSGNVLLVTGAARLSLVTAGVGLGMMLVALAAQGAGHKSETSPPVPFRSPLDFVARFFVEQWVNLPRFLLGGGWRSAFAKTRS
jgi:hypothetical protein